MTPRLSYALAALGLFLVEVLIALFAHDGLIRPYVGDALAVMLVYCFLRAAIPLGLWPTLAITLVIALAVEFAQLFRLLDALGVGGNQLARIVVGGLFDVMDLGAYTAGAFVIVALEFLLKRKPTP